MHMEGNRLHATGDGLAWQINVWDRLAPLYQREIDARFAPVVAALVARAAPRPGERVLDVGTGTGAVALAVAPLVAPGGHVLALDVSPQMVALARRQVAARGLDNVTVQEGRAEALPVEDAAVDLVLASLSLMYVLDRGAAACEIGRVLQPGGRLVAAVWAGPEECDIVRFQQTAGRFAPAPPVAGVGPGALADPAPFLTQLSAAGVTAWVQRETLGFDFATFDMAWEVLAGVTAAQLPPERQQEARAAVQAAMWSQPHRPHHFRNVTQIIVGVRSVTRGGE